MVQGDEPLVSPDSISKALRNLVNNDTNIVNIMSKFKEEDAFRDKNNVKVVVDINNNALYFSREPIPSPWKGWRKHSSFMQTGIIAFKSNALYDFNNQEETALELVESIDMNRVLENGGKVRMVLSEEFMIGVDTKEELILAENELKTSKFTSEYL
jgi:3-deoxy-manno-octulosonate cytidylyltransferase (CMP-KDO synthetase)